MAKLQSGTLLTLVMADRRSTVPPVDGEGMDFDQTAAGIPRLRLAFTMPSRHRPLGRMLSLAHQLWPGLEALAQVLAAEQRGA